MDERDKEKVTNKYKRYTNIYKHTRMHMHVYIYVYIYSCTYVYIYVYV